MPLDKQSRPVKLLRLDFIWQASECVQRHIDPEFAIPESLTTSAELAKCVAALPDIKQLSDGHESRPFGQQPQQQCAAAATITANIDYFRYRPARWFHYGSYLPLPRWRRAVSSRPSAVIFVIDRITGG